jgi:hypothetical protein
MRSHGVPDFPDPTNAGGASKQAVVSALQAIGGSRAQAAQIACVNVNGGSPGAGGGQSHNQAHTTAMLAFARCIRSHGFLKFPDPTTSGQLSQEMLSTAGINLHEPRLLRVADSCTGVTHGMITKAAVARFVAGG